MMLIIVLGLALLALLAYRAGWFNRFAPQSSTSPLMPPPPVFFNDGPILPRLLAEIEAGEKDKKSKEAMDKLQKLLAPKDATAPPAS